MNIRARVEGNVATSEETNLLETVVGVGVITYPRV